MSYAPWGPEVAEWVRQPHQQTFRAVATDGVHSVELDLLDALVDETERRTPRISATLDCAVPDAAVFEWLDPRALVRVNLFAGYGMPGGQVVEHQLYSLHLRARSTRRPGDVMTLTATSDEFLVIEQHVATGGVPAASGYDTAATWSAGAVDFARGWIDEMLHFLPPLSWQIDMTDTGPAPYTEEIDVWDNIETHMELYGFDVWHDGLDTWRITPRAETPGEPAHEIVVGQTGTLVESNSTVDRDNFANFVSIRYEYFDAPSGQTFYDYGTAKITAGPFAVGVSGWVTLNEYRNAKVSNMATRDAAAQRLLTRMLSRSRGLTLDAVNAWWLHATDTVLVQLATGGAQSHIVAGITRRPLTGAMTVVTRLPDTANTIGE